MADHEALKLIRAGVEKWNGARPKAPLSPRSLAGADLSGMDLSRIDLRHADLSNANLTDCTIRDAWLDHADLRGVSLERADLTRSSLRSATMIGADLRNAVLQQAQLDGCDLTRGLVDGTSFDQASLTRARLAELRPHDKTGSYQPHGPVFTRSNLQSANLRHCVFENCLFTRADLQRTSILEVSFRSCHVAQTKWQNCWIKQSDLSGASLEAAEFQQAMVLDCDLHEVQVDQVTSLSSVRSVAGSKIDRFTLETLIGQDAMKPGQRMVMHVYDDVAKLRLAFSGFYRWIHIAALITFLLPYVWFVAVHHVRGQFDDGSHETIILAAALLRFICSGRDDWHSGWRFEWYPMTLFALAVALNVVRFQLLWKTNQLEHAEKVTTMPSRWSLRDHPYWRIAFQFSKWALRLFVVIAVLRFILFLWEPIPVPGEA